MDPIIIKDDFSITQDESYNNLYTIHFNSYSESLIKSVSKTKILLGATCTNDFNSLTFKANSVKTFKQFQKDHTKIYGSSNICYAILLKMVKSLVSQLSYLISITSQTFIGDDIEVDHTIPISLGGKDSIDNLQITHKDSNRKKGSKNSF